jgi:hypothetical protein
MGMHYLANTSKNKKIKEISTLLASKPERA